MGYSALTLSIMHTLFFGWDFAFHAEAYYFYMPPSYLVAVALPCTVLVCRCFLLLPFISTRLARIRHGWESKHNCPVLQRHHVVANGISQQTWKYFVIVYSPSWDLVEIHRPELCSHVYSTSGFALNVLYLSDKTYIYYAHTFSNEFYYGFSEVRSITHLWVFWPSTTSNSARLYSYS